MTFTRERVQRRSGGLRRKAKIEVVWDIMKILGAGCGSNYYDEILKAGYGIRQSHAYAGMVSESRNLKIYPQE